LALSLLAAACVTTGCSDEDASDVTSTADAGKDIAFAGDIVGLFDAAGDLDAQAADVAPVSDTSSDSASAQDSGQPDIPGFDAGPADVPFALDSTNPADAASASDSVTLPDAEAGDTPSSADSDGASAGDAASPHPLGCTSITSKLIFNKETVTASLGATVNGLRTYHLHSTAPLLDGPKHGKRTVKEHAGWPRMRSCNRVIDAMYALAIDEVIQNSVDSVQEAAFNAGKPVPCKCFQTGAKWTWAWTRDSAYAIDLGLALLDPLRSRNTLLFKTSEPKKGVTGGAQIVQDTGTGGGWPVSTDRVSWVLGAVAVRNALTGSERADFDKKITPIIANTLARNATVAFDPARKLYRGETSFLDWREQSYPAWFADRPGDIAMSEAQSTNLLHAFAVDALKTLGAKPTPAIHPTPASLNAAYTTTFFDRAPAGQQDLLGLALLARRDGPTKFPKALLNYPYSGGGPPVFYPQLTHAPIYHNRATWPFVTAYALSVHSQPDWVSDVAWRLIGTTALQLSNMENFEAASGAPHVQDGKLSGPVVNSRRQLWSVAGYLHVMHRLVFGVHQRAESLTVGQSARLPESLAKALGYGTSVELIELPVWGASVRVRVNLPVKKLTPGRWLTAKTGDPAAQPISRKGFTPGAKKSVELDFVRKTATAGGGAETPVKPTDKPLTWFAPPTPHIDSVKLINNVPQISWNGTVKAGLVYDIYRDGMYVGTDKTQGLTNIKWTDNIYAKDILAPCYTIAARWTTTNLRSPHSPPACYWGENSWRVHDITASRLGGSPVTSTGASWQAKWSTAHGKAHWADWGRWIGAKTPERAVVHAFVPRATGHYVLQLLYANAAGPVSTGIACANKRVRLFDAAQIDPASSTPFKAAKTEPMDGAGQGFAVMPQLGTKHRWGESTVVRLGKLDAGKPYHIVIDEDGGVMNMTYMKHSEIYGGTGGGKEPYNRVDLAGARVLATTGKASKAAKAPVAFDGKNDLDKLTKDTWHTPGVTLATWERAAFTWNKTHLQGAIVSKAFESNGPAYVVYLGATDGTGGPPVKTAKGMTYLGQTPDIPFEPLWAIAVRAKTDLADGYGPWSGIYRRLSTGQWVLQRRFEVGVHAWTSADKHTVSFTLPRAELAGLGTTSKWRVCGHAVNGKPGHEYKDVIPATHSPWKAQKTGYYEVDFGSSSALKNWVVK